LNTTQPAAEYGPAINSHVGTSVSRLYQNKQPKEKLDKLREEYRTPENCKLLCVPRVNQEIWSSLPAKVRHVDFGMQAQQQYVTTASVILTKLAEKLFTVNVSQLPTQRDDLLKSVLESLTVLGALSQEINQKRKLDMKPFLSKEISTICSNSESTDLLFGDNLSEQVKLAKATNNLVRSTQPLRQGFKGNRFSPYKPRENVSTPLNWRGPPRRGGNRGRFQQKRYSHPQSGTQFNQRP